LMTQDSRRRIATSLRRHKAIEQLVAGAGGYPQAPPGLIADEAEPEQEAEPAATAAQTETPTETLTETPAPPEAKETSG
jgi:hypothetical protein